MTVKIKLRPSPDLLYEVILWALLLYGGGYLMLEPFNIIVPIALFVLLLINVTKRRVTFALKDIRLLFLMLSYIMFLYAYHSFMGASIRTYVNIGIGVVNVFFFNKIINNRVRFIYLYEKVMLFICAYSCIFYGLNWFFGFTYTKPMTVSLYKLWMGQNIKSITRNSGPFWEPGIFQIYIVIALYFALFLFKDKHGKFPLQYVLIYGITILTTISTTGYLIMGGLLLWKYVSITRANRKMQVKVTMFFLIPAVSLVVSAIILSTPAVAKKFQPNNGSLIIRSSEVAETIPIIRDSGMFGKGANTIARQSLMIRHGIGGVGGDGTTNSVGYSELASIHGWVTLLIFMLRILHVCRICFKEQWLLLYGIMLVTWTTGAVMLIPLYYFFFIGFEVSDSIQSLTNGEAI